MKSQIGECVYILYFRKWSAKYPRIYWEERLRKLIYENT